MVKLGSYDNGIVESPVRFWLGPPMIFKLSINFNTLVTYAAFGRQKSTKLPSVFLNEFSYSVLL